MPQPRCNFTAEYAVGAIVFFPATDQVRERLTEDTNYVLKIQYNQMKLFTVTAHVIMSACFSQHIRCLATIFAYPVT